MGINKVGIDEMGINEVGIDEVGITLDYKGTRKNDTSRTHCLYLAQYQ